MKKTWFESILLRYDFFEYLIFDQDNFAENKKAPNGLFISYSIFAKINDSQVMHRQFSIRKKKRKSCSKDFILVTDKGKRGSSLMRL